MTMTECLKTLNFCYDVDDDITSTLSVADGLTRRWSHFSS